MKHVYKTVGSFFITPVVALCMSQSAFAEIPEEEWTPATLSVLGEVTVNGEYVDRNASEDFVNLNGIQAMNQRIYQFKRADWIQLVNATELFMDPIDGSVMKIYYYTDQTVPIDVLNLGDVKGMSVFIRSMGEYFHRFYTPNSVGVFVEDSRFYDELVGDPTCAVSIGLHSVSLGGNLPLFSSVYSVERDQDNKWNAGIMSAGITDPDLLGLLLTTPESSQRMGTAPPMDKGCIDGGCGLGEDWECSDYWGCSAEGKACNMLTWQCYSPSEWNPRCPGREAVAKGMIPEASLDPTLLYTFRDAAYTNPQMAAHMGTYYFWGMIDEPTQEEADLIPAAQVVVNKIVNGADSVVVIGPTFYQLATSTISANMGQNTILDAGFIALQDDLDAVNGMTRYNFCLTLTGSTNCGF